MVIAGAAIDPELLVWTPKPMITVPAMPSELAKFNDAMLMREQLRAIAKVFGVPYPVLIADPQ
jgi:hypothetical protein